LTKKFMALIVALLLIGTLGFSACNITGDDVTDPSVTTLRYEGGSTQGREFKECVPAGSKMASDDTFYPYPDTQRQDMYDSTNKAADHPDLGKDGTLTDSAGVPMSAKVNVAFFLNTSCAPLDKTDDHKAYPGGVLQAYHELVGKTRHAYFNDDGSYGDGWINAMNYYISPQIESFISDATRQYGAEALWHNEPVDDGNGGKIGVRQKIAADLQAALPKMVNDNMETDLQFYQGFKVTITAFTPDGEFLNILKERQAAALKAQTAQDNAAAQVAEANAATQVAAAQAATLQAQIAGYGNVNNYLLAQAIEAGINPFQPGGAVLTSAAK
jgi:hypothetical protein